MGNGRGPRPTLAEIPLNFLNDQYKSRIGTRSEVIIEPFDQEETTELYDELEPLYP